MQLRDTVLLTSVLSQLLPHIAQADSQAPRDVIQQVKSSLLLTEKVNNAELVAAGLLTGLYLRRADGKQSAWTAQNLQQAGQLWSAVSSKSVIDAQSYASLLKTLLNGLDDNVATKKSLEPSFVLTTFLTDNLLNGGWTEQQVALTLSEAGVSVLDKIIDHYTAVKDVDHISTLLFLSMKHVSIITSQLIFG